MKKPAYILAAELHEAAARSHQIAAALIRQGAFAQSIGLAISAMTDSVKAHRACVLAADFSGVAPPPCDVVAPELSQETSAGRRDRLLHVGEPQPFGQVVPFRPDRRRTGR